MIVPAVIGRVLALVGALLVTLLPQPQAPLPATPGNATIRGHVLRADGLPLARAEVRVASVDNLVPSRTTITDENGSYEFARLPAGRYLLFASKTGFVSREFGRTDGLGTVAEPMVLAARETRERVDVALPRHGAISGRVVDENGDPIEGLNVSVRAVQSSGRGTRLTTVEGVAARRTNELGRFRLYGLQPGDYVVSADVGPTGSDDLPGYPVTYFPGTINPMEAQRIHVGAAEDVVNIEFALSPIRTARITGRTFTVTGEPAQASVQMRPSWRSTGAIADAVGARVESDGSFEFTNVPPGEYVVQAFKGVEMGWQLATVNASEVTDVAMTMLPGSTIAGRVIFENGEAPSARDMDLTVAPADPDQTPFIGAASRADIHDDWTFELTDVIGPGRLRVARAPSGWSVSRVIVNALDAIDAVMPFGAESQSLTDVQILMTSKITRLSGTVVDASRAVIAFTEDRDRWYQGSRFLAAARATPAGRFSIDGLPAGAYLVAAVERLPDGDDWEDPYFLGPLAARATRIALTDDQPFTIILRR
jgi:uncharacterized protein (DUF2141 family)